MGVRGSRESLAGLVIAATLMLCLRSAPAQTLVRLTLDGPIEGPAAPVLVAIDKGYFQREGLDVRIEPAADVLTPITRVASGAFDIGIADINALIKWRDQHPTAPVKAVFMLHNRPAYAIIGRKSRGIFTLKDVEGKKLGAPIASASTAQLLLLAELNGIEPGTVAVEPVGILVRDPMLAAGQLDAVAGAAYRSYVDLKDRGVAPADLVVFAMADYGLVLYGSAVIVNAKFAAEKSEAVRGFVRALLAGLRETVAHPEQAVDSVLRRNDVAKKDVELERLTMALRENIVTAEVRANGFGSVEAARMEKAIGQLALTYKFKVVPAPDQVLDQSFLPPAAERRVD